MVERSRPAHPLLPLLLAAASGTFPAVDGQAVFLPPLDANLQAVVSFTGHAVLATALPKSELADLELYVSAPHCTRPSCSAWPATAGTSALST